MSMRQDNQTVITLRPSVWQFFINELPMLLLCICALAVGGLPNKEIGKTALAIAGLLSLCLLYRFIYLRNIRYHIGSEQIICELENKTSGVLKLYDEVVVKGRNLYDGKIVG